MMKNVWHLSLLFLVAALPTWSQSDIAVGTWRLHLSYNDIRYIAVSETDVFAASYSGIIMYNITDRSLHTINKLNGLSATGISALAFDDKNRALLVGYEDGTLDIIDGNTVISFDRLRDSDIASIKRINNIAVSDGLAYLTTGYGVVVFDVRQKQIKETWRDLGPVGEALAINEIAFLNDTVFLATERGVMAGSRSDNLLDFNNWKRYDVGAFAGDIRTLSVFENNVYVAGPTGVYRYADGTWAAPFLESVPVESLTSSNSGLVITGNGNVYTFTNGELLQISDPLIQAPAIAKHDNTGTLWIGDESGGLLSNASGSFVAYRPNGPSLVSAFRMVSHQGRLYALPGGFSSSGQPLQLPGHLNVFEKGSWSTVVQPIDDLTDIAFMDDQIFISSFGGGMAVTDASGNTSIINESNSPLIGVPNSSPQITAMHASPDGLWVGLYNGNEPLHLLKRNGTWQSFSFGLPNEDKPIDLLVSDNGTVWMVLQPNTAGGFIAYEVQNDRSLFISNVTGQGALPDKNVNSIGMDREGYAWVGTDAGVAYFLSPSQDAIKPVYENRFLLRDERITAIEVDGGNRKWIGTERGAWLFNDTGDVLINHFTEDNSPLLSDVIRDIEIDGVTGEVFISTDRGIASYRADATAATEEFQTIKIFPNPVYPGYSGVVGINGLANDAVVKITDIRGKLLWQTTANGGMASWNVRDQNGKRAPTGVYLVFAIAQDGKESMVGKVAVIE